MVLSPSGDIVTSSPGQEPQFSAAMAPDTSSHAAPHNPGSRPRTFADLSADEQHARRTCLAETLRARQAQREVSWFLRPWGWGHSAAVAAVVGGLLAYSSVVDGTLIITTGSELVLGA